MEWLRVARYKELLSHTRFLLTLRSKEGHYHSLILFRLAAAADTQNDQEVSGNTPSNFHQVYIMESSCPHLGADLSHAEIEECDTSYVAVCPWHRYDFDLQTGKSDTGLKACTYAVEIRMEELDDPVVHAETPAGGHDWRLVELRPVSEEFADPPPSNPFNNAKVPLPSVPRSVEEPLVPDPAPTTLIQWAILILNTPNPILKVQRTRHATHMFRTGKLVSIGHKSSNSPKPPDIPPREDIHLKNTVDPSKVRARKNRAVMLHALANIEQWAIDLAWDIMARFGPKHPNLPHAFFSDFTKMAEDEAKHFSLLTSRLSETSPNTPYGSMPVHASLWESATITSESLRSRLAIIHLVHEARGLDVNPGTIDRFRKAGDLDSVKVMEVIHADEVTHVTAGHRWFTWICEQEGQVDPITTFREEVRKGWRGDIKGPFNEEARERAGMTKEFYENLRGEMGNAPDRAERALPQQEQANVRMEYEKAGP